MPRKITKKDKEYRPINAVKHEWSNVVSFKNLCHKTNIIQLKKTKSKRYITASSNNPKDFSTIPKMCIRTAENFLNSAYPNAVWMMSEGKPRSMIVILNPPKNKSIPGFIKLIAISLVFWCAGYPLSACLRG